MFDELLKKAKQAKEAQLKLSNLSTEIKNRALNLISEEVRKRTAEIISANKVDCEEGKKKGLSNALIDRLMLNEKRLKDIAKSIKDVINLKDPVGEIISGGRRPNGLLITKVRVPIGVIGIIYEARPNVTVDAAVLCLKSGNSVILRGGSEAINSNIALIKIMQDAAYSAGIPEGAIQLIENTSREIALQMMKLNQYIDCLIPRGGAGLIKTVVENATVPIIETGVGNCHIYVDESADLNIAEDIVFNAKVQRPSVCNAMETLLVHKNIAEKFIPKIFQRLKDANVELRGCERTKKIDHTVKDATEDDWFAEYLDLILAVKIVDNIDEVILHIEKYSSHHSEAIITRDLQRAHKFTQLVNSAAVFVNASTRFTDGGEFGLGAEMGISTQKLHCRGPFALEELTTVKFVVWGEGQVRG